MKNFKLVNYFILAVVLSIGIMGCKKEEGPAGPAGPAGTNGTSGTNGNANVKTYVFNSPSWETSGSGLIIDLAGIITDDILENDAILTYVKFTNADLVSSIPGSVFVGGYRNYPVLFGNSTSSDPGPYLMAVISLEMDGSFTPNANLEPIDWLKVVIVESTSTTSATGNGMVLQGKDAVLQELQNAKIDINNYEEVCKYYGISAK